MNNKEGNKYIIIGKRILFYFIVIGVFSFLLVSYPRVQKVYDFIEECMYEPLQLPLYYFSVKYFGKRQTRFLPIYERYCDLDEEKSIPVSEREEINKVSKLVQNLFNIGEEKLKMLHKKQGDNIFLYYFTNPQINCHKVDLNTEPYIQVEWGAKQKKIVSIINFLYRDKENKIENVKDYTIDEYKQIISTVMDYYGFTYNNLKQLNIEKKVKIISINIYGFIGFNFVFDKNVMPDIHKICVIINSKRNEISGVFCDKRGKLL